MRVGDAPASRDHAAGGDARDRSLPAGADVTEGGRRSGWRRFL